MSIIFAIYLELWAVSVVINVNCGEHCKSKAWALHWRFYSPIQNPKSKNRSIMDHIRIYIPDSNWHGQRSLLCSTLLAGKLFSIDFPHLVIHFNYRNHLYSQPVIWNWRKHFMYLEIRLNRLEVNSNFAVHFEGMYELPRNRTYSDLLGFDWIFICYLMATILIVQGND